MALRRLVALCKVASYEVGQLHPLLHRSHCGLLPELMKTQRRKRGLLHKGLLFDELASVHFFELFNQSAGRQDLFLIKILAIAVTVPPCLGVVFTNAFYIMGLAICKRSS